MDALPARNILEASEETDDVLIDSSLSADKFDFASALHDQLKLELQHRDVPLARSSKISAGLTVKEVEDPIEEK
ncbi:hypothetical protein AKJ16_DCAP21865 [Drosera capensis]